MRTIKWSFAVLFLLFNYSIGIASQAQYEILDLNKGVVRIENNIVKAAYSSIGKRHGTGFIIDKKNGILLTNNHVTPRNAVQDITVVFFNGREAEARVLYNDPIQDFAFLKVSEEAIPIDAVHLEISNDDPIVGQEVLMIGNNEGNSFSTQDGRISRIYVSADELSGQNLSISLNSRGGASGSPVLNKDNQVIGIVFGGSDTYSLAIPVQYLRDSFQWIKQEKTPVRNDIGASLTYVSLDKAVKYGSFPAAMVNNYTKKFPNSENLAISILTVPEDSPAHGLLEPGDIVWSVNGEEIGPEMYKMQKIMNNSDSNKVEFLVYRYGKSKIITVNLYDLNKTSISKILLFGEAVFYEVDSRLRLMSGAPLGTLFISASYGSCFAESIPMSYFENFGTINLVNVIKLDNVEVKNLDELVKLIPHLAKKERFIIRYKNFGFTQGFGYAPLLAHSPQESFVDYYSHGSDPVLLTYDERSLSWASYKIPLNDKNSD